MDMNSVHRTVRRLEPWAFYACNPGLLLLLWKHRKQTRRELFRAVWKSAARGDIRMFNKFVHFSVPREKIMHHELRYFVKWVYPDFIPEVEPLNAGQIALLAAAPTVIAIDHSRSEFAFCASLNASRVKYVWIAHRQFVPSELAVYGFKNPLPIIHRGKDAFMRARDAMRAGSVVLGYIDFLKGDVETDKPALFKFSAASRAQLLFARIDIGPEGRMRCVFQRASVNDRPATPLDQTLREFKAFVRP